MLKTIAGCGAAIVGAFFMATGGVAEAGTGTTAQTDIIAIDVLLDPDATAIAAATDVNGKVRQAFPASFELGDTHAPHITMMQRYVHANDLAAIEAAVAGVLAKQDPRSLKLQIVRPHAVSAASLGIPSQPGMGDIGLLFLLVEPTPELRQLQASVEAAIAPFTVADGDANAFVQDPGQTINIPTIAYVKEFVPKASGANYLPHITTGMGPMDVLSKIEAEPLKPVTFSPAKVSIYHLGNFGTARTRLWTWTPGTASSASLSMPMQQ